MNEVKMLTNSELQQHYSALTHSYENFKAQNLKLDMSRGKPCPAQLDLSAGLLDCLSATDYKTQGGVEIVTIVTEQSVKNLALEIGSQVNVLIKASQVILGVKK